jgi:hypothetical protein
MRNIQDVIKGIVCTKISILSVRGSKMRRRYYRQTVLSAVLVTFLVLLLPLITLAQSPSNQWQFAITPYLWLPNIDGTLKYNIPPGASGSPEVKVGPNDYLENLNCAIMINAEVRKARWSIFTDVIYLDFSNEKSNVKSIDFIETGRNAVSSSIDAATESSLKGVSWTLAGGYSVLHGDSGRLELLAGFRYFGVEASSDWNLTATISGPRGDQVFPRSGSISQREDLWDGVIGLRGRLNLGATQFYVPYYFDIGTGSSDVTWEGVVGLGYGFKWVDIVLAYRHLYYDTDDDNLVKDMRFSGPALGLTFRF